MLIINKTRSLSVFFDQGYRNLLIYKSFFLCFLLDIAYGWITEDIYRIDCLCSIETMSGYKRRNNMKTVLIPRAKYISSLIEHRERERRKKGQQSRRHLSMSSKESNECTSSCLLFYQRTSCISSTNISLHLLFLFIS